MNCHHSRLARRAAFRILVPCALTFALAAAEPASTNPVSVAPGINKEYLKPNLDVSQWVERFEKEGREVFTRRERIVRFAGVKPGETLADIGAGTGLFTMLFADAVGPGGAVIAVDIVPDFLKHIETQAKASGRAQVRTVLGTERAVNLPEASVDVVFICDTYHHFEYPKEILASIHRALKPGGRLVLVEFKRVPGESSEWIVKHVRAGEEVFTAEIEAAGFTRQDRGDFLKDNYLLLFKKR